MKVVVYSRVDKNSVCKYKANLKSWRNLLWKMEGSARTHTILQRLHYFRFVRSLREQTHSFRRIFTSLFHPQTGSVFNSRLVFSFLKASAAIVNVRFSSTSSSLVSCSFVLNRCPSAPVRPSRFWRCKFAHNRRAEYEVGAGRSDERRPLRKSGHDGWWIALSAWNEYQLCLMLPVPGASVRWKYDE